MLTGRQSAFLHPHFLQFHLLVDCLFTSSCLRGPFQTNSIRLPASFRALTALLLCHLQLFFCLCNIYDAISHTPLHYSHYEGSTIKCWCHNFHIINNMMSNGTVPFCRKHGTVHPSWLNHPLPSPTTDPSNVTQTSESTFRHMQHFIVVLAAIFFIFNRLFHTLLHTPRCCRMFHPQQGLKIHLAKNTGYCGKLLSNVVGTSVLPSSRSIHGRLSAQLRCVTHFHYGTLSHLLSVK